MFTVCNLDTFTVYKQNIQIFIDSQCCILFITNIQCWGSPAAPLLVLVNVEILRMGVVIGVHPSHFPGISHPFRRCKLLAMERLIFLTNDAKYGVHTLKHLREGHICP